MSEQDFIYKDSNASIWPHVLRQGLIWGLLGVAIQLGMYFTGTLEDSMSGNAPASVSGFTVIVGLAIAIWSIYSAIKSFREEKGSLSFGNAVAVGSMTGLVYGVVSAIWTLILITLVLPDFYENLQEMMYVTYEEMGMEEEQIEQAMTYLKMFSNPIVSFISTVVVGVFYGTILSLIIGIFTKTD